MHRKIFYFLMIFALCGSVLFAQKGRIKGKVTDKNSGEAIIGATVRVVGTNYGNQTDADGAYFIQNLDPGTYEFQVSYIGYHTMTFKNIRINSDETAFQNFGITNEGVEMKEVVVVVDKKLIEKSEAASSTIKTAEDIKSLPSRDLNTAINITAGVVPVSGLGTSIRGARFNETAYYLEGINNTAPTSMTQRVGVSFDAVEEVQVQTGGISAEYGNANSGIIRQTLKSGGSQFHASYEYRTDNPTFMSLNDMYAGKKALGQYPSGYNLSSLSFNGPIFSQNVRFFENIEYSSTRGGSQYPEQPYDFGIVSNTPTSDQIPLAWHAGALQKYMSQNLQSNTTLNIDLSNSFQLRLTAILQTNWANNTATGFYYRFDNRGDDYRYYSQAYTARFTHVLSPTMYYELNAAYSYNHYVNRDQWNGENWQAQGDSLLTAQNVGHSVWPRSARDMSLGWHGRYYYPRFLSVWNQSWPQDGYPSTSYYKGDGWSFTANGTLNLNIGKVHTIRIGGQYNISANRSWQPPVQVGWYQGISAYMTANPTLTADQAAANYRNINYFGGYGYDVNGNETTDDFDGAFKPIFASAFITDAIEFEDVIINVGLRYDYINPNSMKLKDPTNPQLGVYKDALGYHIDPTGWEKVSPSNVVSPRINIVFPVSEKTKFRATYGNYVQMPNLSQMYYRPLEWVRELASGYFQTYAAQNMRPTRTTTYEIGIEQAVTDFLAFNLTGYYRDVKDELVNIKQAVSKDCPWQEYLTYSNGDFATTKGIELNMTMRRYQNLLLNGSISFSDARGTGSNPNSNLGVLGAPLANQYFVPQYVAPLNYNCPLRGSLNIDYHFPQDHSSPILSGLGFSLLMSYSNGHPYTRGLGSSAQLGTSTGSGDPRSRVAVEPLNNSYTPNIFTADAKIDKTFKIYDRLNGNIYLQINNCFNIRNVRNVYVKSGSAYDDGYLSDPSEVSAVRATYGETWYAWNEFLLQYQNGFVDIPRTFVLGIRLEY